MTKQTHLLLRSILLFAILYLSFFILGGVVLGGCCYLFVLFWTEGNKYDIPTPIIAVLLIGSILLIVKMAESLYEIPRIDRPELREVIRKEEPLLFQLIDEVAETMQIATPMKVYLSATVSASVFFKARLWNAFFPGKKNLEIGLGLINVLNKEELRAVLAHEFGHFSQKAMALAGPVYVIGQSVQYLMQKVELKKRGTFQDQYYAFVSIFRVLVELLFSKLSKDYAAFAEELEFDADRVAIESVGREALMSALFKVTFASEMFDQALNSIGILVRSEKGVSDFYKVQHCVMSSWMKVKGLRWSEAFIDEPLPDTHLSRLSEKRIDRLRLLSGSSMVMQNIPALSQELLTDYMEKCIKFTVDIYQKQFCVNPETLTIYSMPSYQKWITKYLFQMEGRTVVDNRVAEVEVFLKDHLHRVPLADWFFDVYLNDKKLGKGYYKKGFSFKSKMAIGTYSLTIKGLSLREASLPVIIEKPGIYKVCLDYRLRFWKAEYEFFIKECLFSV